MLKPLPVNDPTYDILRTEKQPLNYIFAPKTVAVIGASEKPGSVGRNLLWNLISSPFGGTVFPINPKRNSILGIKAYTSLYEVPEKVELAIIATPAPTVPKIVAECVELGVKGAIIISAGFKEIGPEGKKLEEEIMKIARGKMRIIGPNCLGLMNPISGLNATFASTMANPGHLGFISQSGALCTAILDWSFAENVGFSAFISIGSMLDVDWGDLIYYLGDDPHTKSIVLYMESIGNASSFLSAAREVALTKPIIIIKGGQTEAAAKAAASHTGALTGSDQVLEAAFRRCGVSRVQRIEQLFDMAELLAKEHHLPQGKKLTIITNAGGPGVLATDALIATGGELATLTEETVNKLNEFLPLHWSHNNPIDILGDADPQRYSKTLEVALEDGESDGLLVILTPQAMTNPTKIAAELKSYVKKANKPVIASFMGGEEVTPGENILNEASIPTYRYPDEAAHLFNLMAQYSYNLRGIYETPSLPEDKEGIPDRPLASKIIEEVKASKRVILTELESKQLLSSYGIPTVKTGIATSENEAVELAESMGYPVVLKIYSQTITHKTDVGGVQLNLRGGDEVRKAFRFIQNSVFEKVGEGHFLGVTVQPMINVNDAYELIIGSSLDVQFGPVIVFGTGGQLVEIFRDRAIALPPLNSTLARRLMEQTKIYKALQGVRGRKPVDLEALEDILVRFSQLVVEQPWIKEIDINPLLASEEGFMALDARVILHPLDFREEELPRPAIRPYPLKYAQEWSMKDGTKLNIRPIRPEDEPLMRQFHSRLSEESIYFRYFHLIKLNQRISHERLTRICFLDYDREMALVGEYKNPDTGEPEILAVGRLSKLHGINEGEFAMMIIDEYQCRGIGTELLTRLVQIAKDEQLDRVRADILPQNKAMQRVCQKVGFTLNRQSDLVTAEIQC